jgi:hypothetical protein
MVNPPLVPFDQKIVRPPVAALNLEDEFVIAPRDQ